MALSLIHGGGRNLYLRKFAFVVSKSSVAEVCVVCVLCVCEGKGIELFLFLFFGFFGLFI